MGTILTVSVEQGDPVEEGQLLAELDDREVKARVAAVSARLDQAKAAYARAAADFRRYSELLEKNATTRERYESSKADFDSADAAVKAAQAAVDEAEIYVDYTEIRAPLSGVVAEKLAEPGDLALPGKPILTIQDPEDLRLEADVRESLVTHLSLGSTVTVLFGDPLNESIVTKIEERAPEADPIARTFRVKAPLGGESEARAGNFGRLRFRTGERTALLVPPAAVRRIGQLETVRVLEEDRVRVRHVRTGRRDGDLVEVLSGLSAGERIVVGR
jgi:RND family efflux transporter MFP subunit